MTPAGVCQSTSSWSSAQRHPPCPLSSELLQQFLDSRLWEPKHRAMHDQVPFLSSVKFLVGKLTHKHMSEWTGQTHRGVSACCAWMLLISESLGAGGLGPAVSGLKGKVRDLRPVLRELCHFTCVWLGFAPSLCGSVLCQVLWMVWRREPPSAPQLPAEP